MRYKKLTRSFATMKAVDQNGNVVNEVQTSNTQQQQANGTTGTAAPVAPKGQPVQLSIDFGAAQPQANPQPQAATTTTTQAQPQQSANQNFVGPTLVDFGAPVDNQAQQAVNAGQQQTQTTLPPTPNSYTDAKGNKVDSNAQSTNGQQTTPPPTPDSYTDAQGNKVNNTTQTQQNQQQPRSILNPVSLADLRKQSGTGAVPADKKKGWWEKLATKMVGNSAAKYYRNNGQSVAGGLVKQGLKNLGGLAATGALGAMTGGLGALVGGRLINSSIRNSNTSLQNARREGQMRDAYAKQLKELMNARKTGKISDEQYISMRNSALENMKQEKAKIHDIAQNGRSITNPTEGASRIGNLFRRFLPFNRNKAAINYINQTKDNTKWLQQQKNGQYNNNGEYLNNGGYRYNNN